MSKHLQYETQLTRETRLGKKNPSRNMRKKYVKKPKKKVTKDES